MRIEQRGSKWVVLPESGDKVLGTHKTKTDAEAQLRAIESSKARAAQHSTFDAQVAADGQVRSHVWDLVCLPGHDEKDGQSTDFDPKTLGQMVDNFVARGDMIMVDWNHQSSYAKVNGQPAPALAWYGALALVWGGKIAKLGDVAETGEMQYDGLDLGRDGLWAYRCEVTECGQRLLPNFKYLSPTFTPAGTDRAGNEVGYMLVAVAATNTPWQSGTELTMAADENGPAFAKGERCFVEGYGGGRGIGTIEETYPSPYGQRYRVKLDTGQVLDVEQQAITRMEIIMALTQGSWCRYPRGLGQVQAINPDGTVMVSGPLEDPPQRRTTGMYRKNQVEEISQRQGEEADIAGRQAAGQDPRPGYKSYESGDAVATNRKENHMAKLAKLAALMNMEGAEDSEVKKALEAKMDEEAAKSMEEETYDYAGAAADLEAKAQAYEDAHMEEEDGEEAPHIVMRRMAARFRKMGDPPFGGKETPSEEAAEKEAMKQEGDEEDAKMATMQASLRATQAALAKLQAAENERTAAAAKEQARQFEQLADQAVAGGYPREARAALVRFARTDLEGARASVAPFLKTAALPQLFQRMTASGAPIGVDARTVAGLPGSDSRVVEMGHFGKGLLIGEKLSAAVTELADSEEPKLRARVDRELPAGIKGTRFESAERYLAAEKILKREQPFLFEAATIND